MHFCEIMYCLPAVITFVKVTCRSLLLTDRRETWILVDHPWFYFAVLKEKFCTENIQIPSPDDDIRLLARIASHYNRRIIEIS